MKPQRTLWALVDREDGEIIWASVNKPKRDGEWWMDSADWRALYPFFYAKLKRIKAKVL